MIKLERKQQIIIVVILSIMLLVIGIYIYKKTEYKNLDLEEGLEEGNCVQEDITKVVVHITGCVEKEGVVEIIEGDRLSDVIEKAGGTTLDADLSKVNLAYKVEDGQKIYIPSINEKNEETEENANENMEYITKNSGDNIIKDEENNLKGGSSMININKATQTELETLPGIGPSTALKIINYRNENGKFSSIEDIKNVKGIGDAKYDSIKDLISVK